MKAIDTYLDDAWQPYPEEWPKAGIPHVPKAQAERAIQAALDDAAAYRQQVAEQLRALGDHLNRPDFRRLREMAARLQIDLTAPQA
jgi:hypothetical protein